MVASLGFGVLRLLPDHSISKTTEDERVAPFVKKFDAMLCAFCSLIGAAKSEKAISRNGIVINLFIVVSLFRSWICLIW